MLGVELVQAIEDTKCSGVIPDNLNTTYLTLIPKLDRPVSVGDYRPIALCNLLYKLITKIIAERLKPVLGKFISVEQFGFLPNRQILHAVGIVQEVLQSVKSKKLSALILTLDLEKAYDKVDWSFLRLILF